MNVIILNRVCMYASIFCCSVSYTTYYAVYIVVMCKTFICSIHTTLSKDSFYPELHYCHARAAPLVLDNCLTGRRDLRICRLVVLVMDTPRAIIQHLPIMGGSRFEELSQLAPSCLLASQHVFQGDPLPCWPLLCDALPTWALHRPCGCSLPLPTHFSQQAPIM